MQQGLENCSTGVKRTVHQWPQLASGTDLHPKWPSSGWMALPTEFAQTLGELKDREAWRAAMGSQGVRHDCVTEQQLVLRSVQYLNSHCSQKHNRGFTYPSSENLEKSFSSKAIINQKNSIFWISKFNQPSNWQQAQANRRAWKQPSVTCLSTSRGKGNRQSPISCEVGGPIHRG